MMPPPMTTTSAVDGSVMVSPFPSPVIRPASVWNPSPRRLIAWPEGRRKPPFAARPAGYDKTEIFGWYRSLTTFARGKPMIGSGRFGKLAASVACSVAVLAGAHAPAVAGDVAAGSQLIS